MNHEPFFLAGLALFGATVGYASGLFGVGGGFMLTPLLNALFGIAWPIAVGSGLAQMIATGFTAARRHAGAGFVDGRLALAMGPGIIGGSFLGKHGLDQLNRLGHISIGTHQLSVTNLAMNGMFAVLLIGIAVRMWRESSQDAAATGTGPWRWSAGPLPVALPISNIERCSFISLTAGGLLLGVLSGLLGIGGGVLLIPMLLYGFGLPLRVAIGSSALIVFISSVVGTAMHAAAGHVDLWVVVALMFGSTFGVQIGVWHSHRLHATHLQRSFALLVMAVAAIVVCRLWG